MREVRQGEFYRHFKDRLYQIIAVAEHSETGERMVVYQALYGDYRVYVRPYEMFVSEVDREKYPDARQRYRFERVEFPQEQAQKEQTEMKRPDPEKPPAAEPEKAAVSAPEEDGVNPILLEFLDADSLEEKMHILAYYSNQMDEELLNSIAISLDLVVEKKGVQEKYEEILNCLSMRKHFEKQSRFR